MGKKITERTPFGSRMFESRRKSGLSQEVVCERVGCTQGTLSELERLHNSSGLTPQFADLYKVNPKWLATGKGEMTSKVAKERQDHVLTAQELRLLEAYRKQPSEEIKAGALNLLLTDVNAPPESAGRDSARKGRQAA